MACVGTPLPLPSPSPTFLRRSDNPEFTVPSIRQFRSHGLRIITVSIAASSFAFLRLLEQCPPTAEEHSSLLVVEESMLSVDKDIVSNALFFLFMFYTSN